MPITILIPTALRAFADAQARVDVEGGTVADALTALVARHAALAPHLFGTDGRLRSYVNIYVNEEDCRHLQQTATELHAGDVVSIVPAIAGGR